MCAAGPKVPRLSARALSLNLSHARSHEESTLRSDGSRARIRYAPAARADHVRKGITITPVAFSAFENVWRQRSVISDVNTPFNTIPLPSANQGHVSELNFSGRQSRLGGLFTGDAGKFKLSGYFEGDFLSSGTTS